MIEFVLNGKRVSADCDASARLLDILRNDFGLTGPKEGCGEGECGACSVLLNGQLANSCLIAAGSIQGATLVGAAAAYVAAVEQATGASASCIPLTPEKLMEAMATLPRGCSIYSAMILGSRGLRKAAAKVNAAHAACC